MVESEELTQEIVDAGRVFGGAYSVSSSLDCDGVSIIGCMLKFNKGGALRGAAFMEGCIVENSTLYPNDDVFLRWCE